MPTTTPFILHTPDRGSWEIVSTSTTSDGFVLGHGMLIDPETEEHITDERDLPVIHDFFLGRAGLAPVGPTPSPVVGKDVL